MNSDYIAIRSTFLLIHRYHLKRQDTIHITSVLRLLTTEHPIIISLQPRRQSKIVALFLRDI